MYSNDLFWYVPATYGLKVLGKPSWGQIEAAASGPHINSCKINCKSIGYKVSVFSQDKLALDGSPLCPPPLTEKLSDSDMTYPPSCPLDKIQTKTFFLNFFGWLFLKLQFQGLVAIGLKSGVVGINPTTLL